MKPVLALLGVLVGLAATAYAATSYTVPYEGSVTITEHALCATVQNYHASNKSLFVPTNTATEWQSFYDNPPPNVSVTGCALPTSGAAASWGLRYWGGLGDGNLTYTNIPGRLTQSGNWHTATWKKLAAGFYHVCGIAPDDTLRCWGYNGSGQLGDGTNIARTTPAPLSGAFASTTWSDVVANNNMTCAIRKTDSYLYCWGENRYGQLGDGTLTTRSSPTALSATGSWNTTAWSGVALNTHSVCAIRTSDKRLFCWGYNFYGQLARGTFDPADNLTSNTVPAAITTTSAWNTTAWASIGGGSHHFCARRQSDTRLFCWGRNQRGQLGTGANTDLAVPTALSATGGWSTTAWKHVGTGDANTCAVRSDDRVFCWGDGRDGRNGNGSSADQNLPNALDSAGGWDTTTWSKLEVGLTNTCGIRAADSKLFCWGYNTLGALGTGDYGQYLTPVPLTSANGWADQTWSQISIGRYFTCALTNTSTAACWGVGAYGNLGNGLFARSVPTHLDQSGDWDTTVWSQVSAGSTHACGIRASDSRIHCWGENGSSALGASAASGSFTPIPLTTSGGYNAMTWASVSAASTFNCGIRSTDRTIHCWGRGTEGQLGDGTTTSRLTPAPLTATAGWSTTAWKSLSTASGGANHMCGIRQSDERMFCWGYNIYGQIGNGTYDDTSIPTALTSTGNWHTTQWSAVAVGHRNTCGIRKSDSRIFCWGDSGEGALGTSASGYVATPTQISSTSAWKAVSVTYRGACAIRSDDLLFCWGTNNFGQLGDGTTTDRAAPTALSTSGGYNAMTWKAVSTGYFHSGRACAIRKTDNRLFCWGDNRYGELGDGTTTSRLTPTAITSTNGWNAEAWADISLGGVFTIGVAQ